MAMSSSGVCRLLVRPLVRRFSTVKIRDNGRVSATLIPGDGVGPELVAALEDVFRAMAIPVDFEVFFMSELQSSLSAPLDTVVESVLKNGLCIKGILATPVDTKDPSVEPLNMRIRKSLDLYANVVKVQSLPGVRSRHGPCAVPESPALDLVVIREQTEGEYSCLEHTSVQGVVESLKVVTANKSLRIAKFAFDYAVRHGRKKVTAVHKANIMKLGDGLFLRSCASIASLYPHIEFETMIVDNCSMQLVSRPQQFDVLLTPNLYGTVLVNLAAGLVGGAGLVAGEGYSNDCIVFEPGARHAYSEQAGKNVANPTAMLLSGANFLDHALLTDHASQLRAAVNKVLRDARVRTRDLGGQATTLQFTKAVIDSLSLETGSKSEASSSSRSYSYWRNMNRLHDV